MREVEEESCFEFYFMTPFNEKFFWWRKRIVREEQKGKITNKKHTSLFDEEKNKDNLNLHKKKPAANV